MTARMNHQLKNTHSIEHHCNLSFLTVPPRGIVDCPYTHSFERWTIGIINERRLS